MNILVTGAMGYLGRGIISNLLNLGHEVIGVDFAPQDSCKAQRYTYYSSDLFQIENPYEFFGKPDVLLHLAWRNGFVHNSSSHIEDLEAHILFLQRMFDSNIKRIAVMGTMHEVGFYEGSIDDNTPCHPETFYGIAKNALRETVISFAKKYEKKYQWLRAYYIVSNSTNGSSIFSKIAKAAEEGKSEFPFTTGKNQYDFLDYDDFCGKVALTVSQDTITGIINISSGYPEKLADRVERFIRENHYDIQLQYGTFPDRPYDSVAIWGNNRKIMNIVKSALMEKE